MFPNSTVAVQDILRQLARLIEYSTSATLLLFYPFMLSTKSYKNNPVKKFGKGIHNLIRYMLKVHYFGMWKFIELKPEESS